LSWIAVARLRTSCGTVFENSAVCRSIEFGELVVRSLGGDGGIAENLRPVLEVGKVELLFASKELKDA
jgi:hypothetical protein